MVRKTKEDALATRELILNTAEALFAQGGVSQTSLNDIAREAGLTRGAIYWHFKNKADLFDAMLKRVILPMDEVLDAQGSDLAADPAGYIETMIMNGVQGLAENPRTQRVLDILMHKTELVDDMLPIRDWHMEAREQCLSKLKAAFEHAQAAGRLAKGVSPTQAAIALHALVDGLFTNWVLKPADFDLAQQTRKAIALFLSALITPGR